MSMTKKTNTAIKFSQEDPKLALLVDRRGLSRGAIKNYDSVFREIYEVFELTPSDLVDIAREDEKPFSTEDGGWDILNLEDRRITKIQNDYKNYLENKNLEPSTIKLKLNTFRAILTEFEIQKPKSPKIDIRTNRIRERDLVSWRDVEKALSFSDGIRNKSIIALMATSGLRGIDVIQLKISDLVDACYIFFEEDEEHTIDVLLAKSPEKENIFPCFEIQPQKTIKKSQICVTFCTIEATVYLWQYLHERIRKDKEYGGDGILKPDDPLFLSAKKSNNGFLTIGAVERMFQRINHRLGNQKDSNGIYGKFRKHSLRKLFSSTYKKGIKKIDLNVDKTTDIDTLSIFTGHVPPNKSNADVYEAIPEDSHDSYLRQTYFQLMDYYSIRPTKTHHVNSKDAEKFDKKIKTLQEESKLKDIQYQRELEEKDKEINDLRTQLAQTITRVDDTNMAIEKLNLKRSKTEMRIIINKHFYNNYHDDLFDKATKNGEQHIILKKCAVIRQLAYELALENESKFNESDKYLDSLIKQAIVKCSFNPDMIIPKYKEIRERECQLQNTKGLLVNIVADVIIIIGEHEDAWDMVKDNQEKLKSTITNNIKNSDYDVANITSEDKRNIAEEVIMEYISVV